MTAHLQDGFLMASGPSSLSLVATGLSSAKLPRKYRFFYRCQITKCNEQESITIKAPRAPFEHTSGKKSKVSQTI